MPATLWAPRLSAMTNVAGVQGRHQDLVDVGAEALAIDRAVEAPRCGQPRDPPRGEQRAGLPAPAGGVVVAARATRCPAVPPKQIGGDAGFVQQHEVGDIPGRRRRVPRDPRGRDVRLIVFGRADRWALFLTVRPRARTARQTVGTSRAWRGRPSAQPRCVGAAQACCAAPPRCGLFLLRRSHKGMASPHKAVAGIATVTRKTALTAAAVSPPGELSPPRRRTASSPPSPVARPGGTAATRRCRG